ncbi:hypothetical protein B0H34DRAFT_828984, partial [Crassisporium funariophilum]
MQMHGTPRLMNVVYSPNTPLSQILSVMGLTQASEESTKHQPLIIAPPYTFTQQSMSKSLRRNSNVVVTSAPAPAMKSKLLLDLFSPRRSLWFRNPENPENIALYIIFRIHASLQLGSPQLITLLTLICTHAPGVHLQPYAIPFIICLLALKPPFVMLRRRTTQSLSSSVNGLALLSSYVMKTRMLSTHAITLDLPLLVESMARWETPPLISFGRVELVHSQNGLTTMSSFAFAMLSLPTATLTSTLFQKHWEYHGKDRNQSPLAPQFLTSASNGIFPNVLYRSQDRRRRSTKRQSRSGYRIQLTPWKMYRNCTENSYMQASWYQLDVLTSPTWKPCWGCFPRILSCRIIPLGTPQMTLTGGVAPSTAAMSLGASLVHALLQTEAPSRMPAQVSVLELSSKEGGAPGGLSRAGKGMGKTLDGPRLLASSSLSALLSGSATPGNTSSSLVTIEGLSKAGGKEGAGTKRRMQFSDESMTSRLLTGALLSHATFPTKKIRPMNHHAESTP